MIDDEKSAYLDDVKEVNETPEIQTDNGDQWNSAGGAQGDNSIAEDYSYNGFVHNYIITLISNQAIDTYKRILASIKDVEIDSIINMDNKSLADYISKIKNNTINSYNTEASEVGDFIRQTLNGIDEEKAAEAIRNYQYTPCAINNDFITMYFIVSIIMMKINKKRDLINFYRKVNMNKMFTAACLANLIKLYFDSGSERINNGGAFVKNGLTLLLNIGYYYGIMSLMPSGNIMDEKSENELYSMLHGKKMEDTKWRDVGRISDELEEVAEKYWQLGGEMNHKELSDVLFIVVKSENRGNKDARWIKDKIVKTARLHKDKVFGSSGSSNMKYDSIKVKPCELESIKEKYPAIDDYKLLSCLIEYERIMRESS